MTEVIIKSVCPFAEYDGLIYSYKVACVLNNGNEIIFIDDKPFDLTALVGQKIVIELSTSFISEDTECNFSFEGAVKYSDLSNTYYFENTELIIYLPKEMAEFSGISLNVIKEYCFEELVLKYLIK